MLLIAASFAVIWLIQVQIDAGGKLRLVRRAGSGPKAFSDALLPMAGVAVAMKAGDDQEGIGFNDEKERLGKFLRARSTGES